MRNEPLLHRRILPHLLSLLFLLGLVGFFFWPFFTGKLSFIWDTREFGFPNLHLVTSSLAQLKLPLWNPLKFSGYPAAGDVEMGLYNPFAWIWSLAFGTLSFSSLATFIALHFAWGGAWMYFFCHRLTRHSIPSILGAVLFLFSGYALGHLSHLGQLLHYLWIPAVFFFVELSLEKRKPVHDLAAGLVLGLSIFTGHYNTTLYLYFALFLLLVFALIAFRPRWSVLGHAALTFLFSILVASVLVFPVAELSLMSNRAHLTYEQQSRGWSLNVQDLKGLVDANHNQILTQDPLKTFSGSVDITQNYLYLGLVPLLLALVGLFSVSAYRHYFLALGTLSLLAAFGEFSPVNWFLFHFFPGFDKARMAVQIMCLFFFSLSALAALGLGRLVSLLHRRQLLAVVLGLALLVFSTSDLLANAYDQRFYSEAVSPSTLFTDPDARLLVRNLNASGPDLFRVSDEAGRIMPGYWEMLGVENVFGNGGIKIGRYNRLFRREDRTRFRPFSDALYDFLGVQYVFSHRPLPLDHFKPETFGPYSYFRNLNVLPRAFLVSDYQVLDNPSAQFSVMREGKIDYSKKVLLDSEPRYLGVPNDRATQPSARVIERTPTSLTLAADTPIPSILVLSETDYPGWRMKVDGQPEPYWTANYAFRAVPLSRGRHVVEFNYRPVSVYWGAALTLASLGAFLAYSVYLLLNDLRKSRHHRGRAGRADRRPRASKKK